jgi:hypothetical protein
MWQEIIEGEHKGWIWNRDMKKSLRFLWGYKNSLRQRLLAVKNARNNSKDIQKHKEYKRKRKIWRVLRRKSVESEGNSFIVNTEPFSGYTNCTLLIYFANNDDY